LHSTLNNGRISRGPTQHGLRRPLTDEYPPPRPPAPGTTTPVGGEEMSRRLSEATPLVDVIHARWHPEGGASKRGSQEQHG
jgi:hypothetical protein